jgi:hypothetical protein
MEPLPYVSDEIWMNIITHLEPEHLKKLRCLSKYMKELADDHQEWRRRFREKFNAELFKDLTDINWKKRYLELENTPIAKLGLIIKSTEFQLKTDDPKAEQITIKEKKNEESYCFQFHMPSKITSSITFELIRKIGPGYARDDRVAIRWYAIDTKEGVVTGVKSPIESDIQWGGIFFNESSRDIFINAFNETALKILKTMKNK